MICIIGKNIVTILAGVKILYGDTCSPWLSDYENNDIQGIRIFLVSYSFFCYYKTLSPKAT